MVYGYFLQKVVGADRNGREHWEVVHFVAVPLDVEDPQADAVTRAIEKMDGWADEYLAAHRGYYELFNICLATRGDEGFPDLIFAEGYRVMLEGVPLRTGHIDDLRPQLAAASV